MKIKLTPLNIVTAISLVAGVLLLLNKRQFQHPGYVDISGTLAGLGFLAGAVFFISDQIFRKFIPSLKRLWIVEGVLIIFIIILIFIIKASLS